jgi:hypothetical protein
MRSPPFALRFNDLFGGAILSERLSIISRSIEPVSIKQQSAAWP